MTGPQVIDTGDPAAAGLDQSAANPGRTRTAWIIGGLGSVDVAIALALWWLSIPRITTAAISDFGLATALPASLYASLAILTISFLALLHSRRAPAGALLLHVVALLVVLHGTIPLVYEEPRYSWTYKHIGVVGYILRTGGVDPSIDAYQNWPGFFTLGALFTELSGMGSALAYATWAQLFFNLLDLGALLFVFRACTADRRLSWLATWIFFIVNWIGQDYFAPQALAYFLYLFVVGAILNWLRPDRREGETGLVRWGRRTILPLLRRLSGTSPAAQPDGDLPDVVSASSSVRARVGASILIIAAFTAIVSSHQLTPFLTIASTIALVLVGRCSSRGLPLLMAVIVGAWLGYMAIAFFGGNLRSILDSIGRVHENIGGDVGDLTGRSVGRVVVALSARGLTVVVWVLAALGGLRRLRHGADDLAVCALAVAPLPFVTQAYGYEMIYRVHLFALPFVAFLIAGLFYPSPSSGRSWPTSLAALATSFALLGVFVLAFYGNERMNMITQSEVSAVRRLYDLARPGSLIVAVNENSPLKLEGYERFQHVWLSDLPEFRRRRLGPDDVTEVARVLADPSYPSTYLLVTRSQQEYDDLLGPLPHGAIASLEAGLRASGRFVVVFENEDARIYGLSTRVRVRQP